MNIYIYFCFECPDQLVSDAMMAELKQCFMEAYDDNQDGKIDIREVYRLHNLVSKQRMLSTVKVMAMMFFSAGSITPHGRKFSAALPF